MAKSEKPSFCFFSRSLPDFGGVPSTKLESPGVTTKNGILRQNPMVCYVCTVSVLSRLSCCQICKYLYAKLLTFLQ